MAEDSPVGGVVRARVCEFVGPAGRSGAGSTVLCSALGLCFPAPPGLKSWIWGGGCREVFGCGASRTRACALVGAVPGTPTVSAGGKKTLERESLNV